MTRDKVFGSRMDRFSLPVMSLFTARASVIGHTQVFFFYLEITTESIDLYMARSYYLDPFCGRIEKILSFNASQLIQKKFFNHVTSLFCKMFSTRNTRGDFCIYI